MTDGVGESYAERQLCTLKELGDLALAARESVALVCEGAAAALANNRADVAFALFYLLDASGQRARLVANVGLASRDSELAPAEISFGKQGQRDPWLIEEVARERAVRIIADNAGLLPVSPGLDAPTSAIVLPLTASDPTKLEGVLVCGVSPQRVLDRGYRTFFELVAAAVVAGFRRARPIEEQSREAEALTKALAESRARADYAVRLSGIGFWYCDLPFDELAWDARVKEHFFLPPDARVTIETFYERIVPEDRTRTRAAIDASIRDHTIYDVVYRTRDPESGAAKWIRAMGGTVYAADGTPLRFDGVTVDISTQKRDEARIAAAAAHAEDASRAKDEFLAMLGHELRNPLAPISTAVHLLKLRSSPNIEREIAVIERQSKHIARLVDDLLDVSRIARGKVALNKDSTEVADIVAAAIETATPAIENGQHELAVNVPRRGLVVDVDRGRMIQVVANLLTNAAKYTPVGGRVCVTAKRERDEVVISVEDTGIGIQAELLARVFDLFVQGRQPLDRSQGGLGLGLALVKNLVTLHGGSVSAESDGLGRGSTFTVRLPALDPAARREEAAQPAVIEPAAPLRQRVLVVDDNVDGAEMLARALEVSGYETTVAHDGLAALRLAADLSPHFALLDIGLPVMDGYELAGKLRERWHDVKLVAITGYGQESDRQRAASAGFHAHLTKPVDFEQLSAVLAGLSS